tara:strand:+ start:203 stop:625 length:423 start_codon:yes stop_codon:yes gene_type:complete
VHNKRPGAVYEYQFFAKAMALGLEIFIPAGDYLPQDCHVVNEKGKVFRVQVKGTRAPVGEGIYKKKPRFRLSTGSGVRSKESIKCENVDILAGYVAPLDTFYIIPCDKLTGVSTWVYPNDPADKHRFEKYRENWDAFKEA